MTTMHTCLAYMCTGSSQEGFGFHLWQLLTTSQPLHNGNALILILGQNKWGQG